MNVSGARMRVPSEAIESAQPLRERTDPTRLSD